ncbi:MAG: alpha/beta hydrolase [Bryobacteraceae bacterium]|nr:alpha/beta hydrolase [Bryobacteraceae bacterium]
MILVSCRSEFVSDHRFAGQNLFRDYPDLKNTGSFTDLDEQSLLAQVMGKHVLVLVHGYRNVLKNVADSYHTVLTKLMDSELVQPPHYDLVLGFLWPGFRTQLGFFPAVPYANRSAGFFRTLLIRLGGSALTVDVQTHSLGARVALQALSATEELFVDNLMLTAAAVDNECLEPGQEFHASLDRCRRTVVYHSNQDKVLKIGFRIASLDRALGLRGPEHPSIIEQKCPTVYVVDCSHVVKKHGSYRMAGAYYSHWARVLGEFPLPRFETLTA